MRQISVSTDVFAAIWANRQVGEETEDDILSRLLASQPQAPANDVYENGAVGHIDLRSGATFPAGLEIFRTYKGTEYRARAVGGAWILATDGKGYMTLNQLSQAIGIASENAWRSWYFINAEGKRSLIDALRR